MSSDTTPFPGPDKPGRNVELVPSAAPAWVRQAMGLEVETALAAIGARSGRAGRPNTANRPSAAVLVLLTGTSDKDGEVLLTHRSPSMRSHPGQIAFPGGRLDPQDRNFIDAALREAWEETGLDRMEVTPVEQLGELQVRATGNRVHPVIAHAPSLPRVGVVNEAEADDVFSVPLAHLADPDNRLRVGFGDWHGPAFRVKDYIVWGFTGGVLSALLDHARWARPWECERVFDLRAILARSRNNEKLK